METKINLFAVTIDQCKNLQEKFRITSEVGYDGIDLMDDAIRRYLKEGYAIDDLANLPKKYNLPVFHLGYLAEWQTHGGIPLVCRFERIKEDTDEKLIREMEEYFEHCSTLGCKYALAPASIGDEGDLEEGARSFQKICSVAERYGLKCAYEFIGWAKKWNNIKFAWELVKRADRPNGGILVDLFHFYSGNSTIEDLRKVPAEKIFVVHINDCVDKPKSELRDSDRVFPGKGIIPLKELLGVIINEKGYDGPLSLELFNEDYWEQNPVEVAEEGKRAVEGILRQI